MQSLFGVLQFQELVRFHVELAYASTLFLLEFLLEQSLWEHPIGEMSQNTSI